MKKTLQEIQSSTQKIWDNINKCDLSKEKQAVLKKIENVEINNNQNNIIDCDDETAIKHEVSEETMDQLFDAGRSALLFFHDKTK